MCKYFLLNYNFINLFCEPKKKKKEIMCIDNAL